MSLVTDLAAVIRRQCEALAEVVAIVNVADQRLTGARRSLADAADGSGVDDLHAASALLAKATDDLDRARAALVAAVESARGYCSDGLGVAVSTTPDVPGPSPAGAGAEVVPEFVRVIAGRLAALLPRGNKTVGVLASTDGAVRSKPIWSGVPGPGAGAPGLGRGPNRWDTLKAVVEHVEGHAAAILRRPGTPDDATLVISRPPCAEDPFGCDRLLPDTLPAGKRLRVYVVGSDGRAQFYKTYTGTGKGIRS